MAIDFPQLGKRISRYRELRSRTQEWLAQEVGISTRTLGKIEHGADCKLSVISDISVALDVSLQELLLVDEEAMMLTGEQRAELLGHIRGMGKLLGD